MIPPSLREVWLAVHYQFQLQLRRNQSYLQAAKRHRLNYLRLVYRLPHGASILHRRMCSLTFQSNSLFQPFTFDHRNKTERKEVNKSYLFEIHSTIGKLNTPKSSSWSEAAVQQNSNTSELWGAPLPIKSARGPPPGLGVNNNKGASTSSATTTTPTGNSNGWISGNMPGRIESSNNSNWTNSNSNSSSSTWPSSWLLLKNLTAQVSDGGQMPQVRQSKFTFNYNHIDCEPFFFIFNWSFAD